MTSVGLWTFDKLVENIVGQILRSDHKDHQRKSWFVVCDNISTLKFMTTFCPTFPETWRSDWLTSTLTVDTLLFLKWYEGQRSAVYSLPSQGVPSTHLVSCFDQTRTNDVSHPIFKKKRKKKPHTNTNVCAHPREKTTITAQETRCHVGS